MRNGIDHVAFAVGSLDEATERLEDLDISPTFGGEHPRANTKMAMVPLPDGTYLELIAPTGPDPAYWPEFLANDAGPCAWCIRSDNVHEECKRVIEHGIQIHGPEHGSRRRPDGVLVEWDQAFIGPSDDYALPFVITDRTPRRYRIPTSDLHQSPISGIGWVVVAVEELDTAVDRFVDLYRLPQPLRDTDPVFGDIAAFPGQRLLLANPTHTRLRERLERYGNAPAAVLLRGDMAAARRRYPLEEDNDWFGRSVGFVEGFDRQLGIVEAETPENPGQSDVLSTQ